MIPQDPTVRERKGTGGSSLDTGERQLLGERYRLVRRIGRGGMGEVFAGEHTTIEKTVAVKILLREHATDPRKKTRFLQEAKATAKVSHPNVIDITDFGETADGRVFFVMEYLEGKTLGDFCLRKQKLPWATTRDILIQVCSALEAAHDLKIIHRDLKPENIFLIPHQEKENFVKVLDFGLAKLLGDDTSERLTSTGIVLGTPAYISPEQISGKDVDHRSDLYSLGTILYVMLCGKLPHRATTVIEMLQKQMNEQPCLPSKISPHIKMPHEAELLALKALEKDPNNRCQTALEMKNSLAAISEFKSNKDPSTIRADPSLTTGEDTLQWRPLMHSEPNRRTPACLPASHAGSTRLGNARNRKQRESARKGSALSLRLIVALALGAVIALVISLT